MRVFLYIAGAAIEFVGIVLVASPDLFPQAQRASKWLSLQYRKTANRVRRIFGWPPGVTTVQIGVADEINIANSLSVVKSSGARTVEEKVEFLLHRDQEAQRDVNELRDRLKTLEGETETKLSTARKAMEDHVAEALRTAHAAYLPLRILGVVALMVGLALVTVGNFVG